MLALVPHSLKPVKRLGPCKRTQHCWPKTPNNTQQCCDLLRPFAWVLRVTRVVRSVLLTHEPVNQRIHFKISPFVYNCLSNKENRTQCRTTLIQLHDLAKACTHAHNQLNLGNCSPESVRTWFWPNRGVELVLPCIQLCFCLSNITPFINKASTHDHWS